MKAWLCPYKATWGDVCDQSRSTKTQWGEFWLCLICYALLVMSVQHQQSEWVECSFSISFMTLYQCEWLDDKNEWEHILLWFKDAFCLPIPLFLLSHAKYCVTSGLHWLMLKQTRSNGRWTELLQLYVWTALIYVNMKTKVRMQIYRLADHFHVMFWLHS